MIVPEERAEEEVEAIVPPEKPKVEEVAKIVIDKTVFIILLNSIIFYYI